MSTYLVFVYGVEVRRLQARNHRAAARNSGLVSPGAVVWADGPDGARSLHETQMRLVATRHSPPHLRLTLIYRH